MRPSRTVVLRCLSVYLGVALAGLAWLAWYDGKGDITGQVTVDGKPLPMGNVVFIPTSGAPAVAASVAADGKYTAVGVPSGEVKVSLDLAAVQSLASAAPKAPGK